MSTQINSKTEQKFNLFKIPLLILISLFIAFITITKDYYFPFLGIFVGVTIYNCWLFLAKKEKSVYNYSIFIACSCFALNFVFKTHPVIIFINILGIIYTQSYLIKKPKTLWQAIFNPCYIPILFVFEISKNHYLNLQKILNSLFNPKHDINKNPQNKNLSSQAIKVIIFKNFASLVLACFVIFVAIPILMSANQVFATWMINTAGLIFSFNLWRVLFDSNLVLKLFLASLVYLNLSFSETLIVNDKNNIEYNYQQTIFNLNIPKLALGTVILIFFASQINLYFLSAEELYQTGKNFGSLNREIFVQLGLIAVLSLSLIYFDIKNKIISIGSSTFLIIESLILIAIGAYSDIAYIQEAGLTSARLYGFSYLATICLAVLIICWFLNKPKHKDGLIQALTISTSAVWIVTNFINFGAMIYANPPRESGRVATKYLVNLSVDSGKLKESTEDVQKYNTNNPVKHLKSIDETPPCYAQNKLKRQYAIQKRIQEKYSQTVIWAFNFAEYKEYQKIKNYTIPDTQECYTIS